MSTTDSQGQLSITLYPECDPITTVRNQHSNAMHNLNRYLGNTNVSIYDHTLSLIVHLSFY